MGFKLRIPLFWLSNLLGLVKGCAIIARFNFLVMEERKRSKYFGQHVYYDRVEKKQKIS
jgi:hypothetical protein